MEWEKEERTVRKRIRKDDSSNGPGSNKEEKAIWTDMDMPKGKKIGSNRCLQNYLIHMLKVKNSLNSCTEAGSDGPVRKSNKLRDKAIKVILPTTSSIGLSPWKSHRHKGKANYEAKAKRKAKGNKSHIHQSSPSGSNRVNYYPLSFQKCKTNRIHSLCFDK